ncbi:MAG: MBL fold metallo-hydrolase [Alphaproteobacteria bacterium]|nr:MBL fold metallo-hydrolase [Alphaproteobacteria bacterium]
MAKNQAKSGTFIEFIGGVNKDKIGGNCSVIEHTNSKGETTRIMTDLGRMFPPYATEFEMALPDVREYFDRLDPDTDDFTKALKPVDALFITHAHEDHIGALIDYTKMGYRLPPIYGSRYTCNRIAVAFANEGMPSPLMNRIKNHTEIDINDISVEAQNFPHSIIGEMGFYTRIQEKGKDPIDIGNNGDFFIAEDMPVGENFSKEEYTDLLTRRTPKYLLIDSTSVSGSKRKRIGFEQALKNRIDVIERNPDRTTIISPVISNANPSIALDCDTARHLGTKICLDGKGLTLMYKAMQMSGYKDFEDVIYKGKLSKYIKDKSIKTKYIVCTGAFAQGLREYKFNQSYTQTIQMSSAVKMALGLHPDVSIDKTVHLLSAQGIIDDINGDTGPEMLQLYASQGAKVTMTPRDKKVADFEEVIMQDSYHMYGYELLDYLKVVKEKSPDCIIIPIHGNPEQCQAVALIAKQAGLKSHIIENTDCLNLETGREIPSKKKKVFNWIGIKSLFPDFRDKDSNIPPEGMKEYYLINADYESMEKIGEAKNVRSYLPEDKGYYHIPGGKYLDEENEDFVIKEKVGKKGGKKISRQEKGDRKSRAERDAEKREELRQRRAAKKAKEQVRIAKKLGKSIID